VNEQDGDVMMKDVWIQKEKEEEEDTI